MNNDEIVNYRSSSIEKYDPNKKSFVDVVLQFLRYVFLSRRRNRALEEREVFIRQLRPFKADCFACGTDGTSFSRQYYPSVMKGIFQYTRFEYPPYFVTTCYHCRAAWYEKTKTSTT